MIRQQKKVLLVGMVLVLLCVAVQGFGQTDVALPKSTRPKIGLALAGGSANGLAHIGVLEWFEQHHIPIDDLAGTSMGGLLGGGYAMGMSPADLRSTFSSIDWNSVFSGDPPYHDLPTRRKEDLRDLQSRLVVGLRRGIELPDGITSGNSINLLLSRLCLPYSELKSFDDLPIPFRCMAVDMRSAQVVALRDGSLATALRATMAIPGVFTPVNRDGTTYTDGATLNNIPTEAVKSMGADVIIAVDLSSSFLTSKKSNSLFDELGRAINIATYANERRSLKLADIVLTPDLHALGGADFTKMDTFAERGYQAAEARQKVLERFALNEADWQAYVAARNSRKRVTVPTPTFVEVTGVKGKAAERLTKQLNEFMNRPSNRPSNGSLNRSLNRPLNSPSNTPSNTPSNAPSNAPFNTAKLDSELTSITGSGRFDGFFYNEIRRDGQTGLLIHPTSKSYGLSLLRFGLQIDGADSDNIRTNLAMRFTALDVGSPGAELRADLRVGSDRDLAVEYYRPVASGRPFFAPRGFVQNTSVGLYSSGARVATYDTTQTGAALDLGYNITPRSELRFGYQFEHQETSVSTGSTLLPSLHGDASSLHLGWQFDGQDSPTIPSRGVRIVVQSHWYFQAPGASRAFPISEVRLSSFRPVSKGDSVFGTLGAGTAFGNTVGPLEQLTVGGPQSLAAYGPNEFRGNDALHLTLGYLHRVGQLPSFLGGKVMLGGIYQVGGAFARFGSGRYLNDASVAFLADTLIGPVLVGYSYGEAGRNRVYFAIGGLF